MPGNPLCNAPHSSSCLLKIDGSKNISSFLTSLCESLMRRGAPPSFPWKSVKSEIDVIVCRRPGSGSPAAPSLCRRLWPITHEDRINIQMWHSVNTGGTCEDCEDILQQRGEKIAGIIPAAVRLRWGIFIWIENSFHYIHTFMSV